MSTKRSKKATVDLSIPNNSKKSKNKVNVETIEDVYDNVKSKKKGNMNSPFNENIAVGKKRKGDNDVMMPAVKKTRKKFANVNSAEDVLEAQSITSESSNNFDINKKPKKSNKKNKVSLNNEECVNKDINNTTETVEPFVQKKNKRKHKSKNEFANDLNSIKSEEPSQEETNSLVYNKSNIRDKLTFKKENDINEADKCFHNGSIQLIVKDLDDSESDLNESEFLPEPIKTSKPNYVINWPQEDLSILVDRMEAGIPDPDTLAFGTRAEKLEWDNIAFKEYSAEDCKRTWLLLQKRIRRFRLLKEVLADVKTWIKAPKSKKKKSTKHPDMPRKPLSAYFIYYLRKKDEYLKANPRSDAAGISKAIGQEFKNLTPEKKAKYEKLADKQKQEYQRKLEEFYQTHPDFPRIVKGQKIKLESKRKKEKPIKVPKETIPKRPSPPFHYYYLSEVQKEKDIVDKVSFKDLCKERWKQMSDEDKVGWINLAEAGYAKYEEALTKYRQNHPEYIYNPSKPMLTKEEIQIKERVAGKPSKPPGSAYSIFARMLLQSNEIKSIHTRDRLNFVSNQWKSCPDEEKEQYKILSAKNSMGFNQNCRKRKAMKRKLKESAIIMLNGDQCVSNYSVNLDVCWLPLLKDELNEKYKADFATYLESLPEEERKLELQKKVPKRRKSEASEAVEKKKKQPKKKPPAKTAIRKIVEPEQPPISPFKYFASLYSGKEPVQQAWKALSAEQKTIYEDELMNKKRVYIIDFENFLKSLSKEELEAFSNSRGKIKKQPEEEDEEEDDEEATETSGESEEESDDENEDSVD